MIDNEMKSKLFGAKEVNLNRNPDLYVKIMENEDGKAIEAKENVELSCKSIYSLSKIVGGLAANLALVLLLEGLLF